MDGIHATTPLGWDGWGVCFYFIGMGGMGWLLLLHWDGMDGLYAPTSLGWDGLGGIIFGPSFSLRIFLGHLQGLTKNYKKNKKTITPLDGIVFNPTREN